MSSKLMNAKNIDLLNAPLGKSIVLYALPIVATGVLQLLFNAADLVVVGRFCGSVSVAAVGATGALINLIVNLFIGLSIGVGVQVATGLGKNDRDMVSNAIHTCIPVAFAGGIALTAIGIVLTEPMLRFMGNPEDVIGLSSIYMKIYFCGMPASLVYNYGAAVLRANGDTRRPLIFLTIAGILNVIMNVIFVVFFDLDVAGVALATALSQLLSAILVVGALMKDTGMIRFEPSKMKIHKESLKKIIKVGLPAGLQGSLFSISNVLIQSSVNSFGSVVMAGCAAASNIEGFSYVTMDAFNHSGMNFIGQNYGAGKYDRVRRVIKLCVIDEIIVGLFVGILTFVFGRQLLGIYITDSPEAIEYGMMRLEFVCTLEFLNGLHNTLTGILRGFGLSFVPMAVTIFGVCVIRIVWINTIFKLAEFHTIKMLFIIYPISWIITAALLGICLHATVKKKLSEY